MLRGNRFIFILVIIVVLAHSLLYVHILRDFPEVGKSFDTQYTNISEQLYRYGAYSTGARDTQGNLVPTLTEPPLYTVAYFISYKIFGLRRSADEAMRVLQMILNVAVIFIVWQIGRLWSIRTGNIAATFAAFDLTAFFFAQNFQIPDTTLGFFMALWLLYLVKFLKQDSSYKNIFLSTLFLGLAIWTKIAVYMLWVPLAFFLALFLWRGISLPLQKKVYLFAVFAVVILVFFGGWKTRNYLATGSWTYASGATSLRWNAAHVVAYQEDIPLVEARERLAKESLTPEIIAMGEGAVERYGSRKMMEIILGSPLDFGIVVLRAMPGMFLGTFPPYMLSNKNTADEVMERVTEARGNRTLLTEFWGEGRIGYVLIYAAAKFHLLLMYAVGAVAVVLLMRDKSVRWILIAMALTVSYTIAVSGAAAQARYRTIIFPIFYVLAGYGVTYILKLIHSPRDYAHSHTP